MSRERIHFDEYEIETDEGRWCVEIDLVVWATPGTPPWKGSVYSCPSDVDWYGEDPMAEIESVKVGPVAWDEIEREDIELAPWERRIIAEHISENLDEYRVFEYLTPDEPW